MHIVSELCEHFHLTSNKVKSIVKCRDKSKTREVLSENFIRQPKFSLINNQNDDILKQIFFIGLPCIVKPIDDTGSNGVFLCSTYNEVLKKIKEILSVSYNIRGQKTIGAALVEEYIEGPEYSVEMFSWNGIHTYIGITQKELGALPYFIEKKHIFPAEIPTETMNEIQQTVCRTLNIMGIDNGPTHTEVKLNESGCYIIEVNARLAGGMIPELISLSTGNDIIEQQIRVAGGLKPQFELVHDEYAGIHFILPHKEGKFISVNNIENIKKLNGIKQVKVTAKHGQTLEKPYSTYSRIGYIIATGRSRDKVAALLEQAIREIELIIA